MTIGAFILSPQSHVTLESVACLDPPPGPGQRPLDLRRRRPAADVPRGSAIGGPVYSGRGRVNAAQRALAGHVRDFHGEVGRLIGQSRRRAATSVTTPTKASATPSTSAIFRLSPLARKSKAILSLRMYLHDIPVL